MPGHRHQYGEGYERVSLRDPSDADYHEGTGRLLGIETEYCCAESWRPFVRLADTQGHGIGTDGSLPSTGHEFRSARLPSSLVTGYARDLRAAVATGLARVNGDCGMHVHIDFSREHPDDAARAAVALAMSEAWLLRPLVPRGRRHNGMCAWAGWQTGMRAYDARYDAACRYRRYHMRGTPGRISWREALDLALYNRIFDLGQILRKYTEYANRYVACNIHSLRYLKTIEVRCWPGTVTRYRLAHRARYCAFIADQALALDDIDLALLRAWIADASMRNRDDRILDLWGLVEGSDWRKWYDTEQRRWL